MREFIYHNKREILVCEDTVQFAPNTFSPRGMYFEPESVEYFYSLVEKQEGSINIADVGAQVGLYTLYAKYLPNAMIYAFEPNPEAFSILEKNCELNAIQNVKLINQGVGDVCGHLDLLVPNTPEEKGLCCFTQTPIRFNTYTTKSVEVTTLDTIFFDRNIPCHFIKCDTEGYELRVLKGGQKTLETYKPDLFIEICNANLKQCGIKREELLEYLQSLGYHLVNVKNDENHHFSVN